MNYGESGSSLEVRLVHDASVVSRLALVLAKVLLEHFGAFGYQRLLSRTKAYRMHVLCTIVALANPLKLC